MKPILLLCLIAIFLTSRPLSSAEMDWQGLDRERIELALPLLVIKGSKGLLACGYVNVKTCVKTINTHNQFKQYIVKLHFTLYISNML